MSVETSNAPRRLWISPHGRDKRDAGGLVVAGLAPDRFPGGDEVEYVRRDLVVPTIDEMIVAIYEDSGAHPRPKDAARTISALLRSRIEGDHEEGARHGQ